MINGSAPRANSTEHVDCVVVGSGFGGSVAAYRFAREGHSVVVLERGKRYPPGSFPRTPAAMSRNFWDPSEGLHGLFDVWSFRGLDGVVSSGLGGGSLIYANVLLRKDEHWFVHESPVPGGGYENWPVTRNELEEHYRSVEQMLGATPYPYPDTPKTAAMRDSAARLGLKYQRLPLAITFASGDDPRPMPGAPITAAEYGNLHGVPRQTCRLCGECDLGCNFGAKNTLDHNYLSAAVRHEAELRTRCEVRGFSPLIGGGYEVRYVVHEGAREGIRTATGRLPLRRITCDRLVLAAGTFGTTYLLLRNWNALPGLSTAVGSRFSGNGDLLGLILNARQGAAGTGARTLEGSRGPVITSAIRVGDELDGQGSTGRGFYIEDAGYPGFVDWLAETSQLPANLRRAVRFGIDRALSHLRDGPRRNISGELAALFGSGSLSESSLPLLAMGRDIPDGVMRLNGGTLTVDWTTKTSERYFERIRATMRAIAADLGGSFRDNPLWWSRRVITAHPLGGAPMGRHPGEGVCDPHGEVFGFKGLYVLDGAAMPGPVGANPSLTIAALADRACDKILSEPRRRSKLPVVPASLAEVPPACRPARHAPAGTEEATSLAFTEEMKGFVTRGVTDSQTGWARGRARGQKMMFRLTITVDDVDAFVADHEHPARAEGYVDCDLLGGRLPVRQGWFNLFTRTDDPDTRQMLYRLHLTDPVGNNLTLVGHKEIHDDPGMDVWSDSSTLYVRILTGHTRPETDDQAPVVGAGVLHIYVRDFVQQLSTFRSQGPRKAAAFVSFMQLFLGELWEVYQPHFGEEVQHENA